MTLHISVVLIGSLSFLTLFYPADGQTFSVKLDKIKVKQTNKPKFGQSYINPKETKVYTKGSLIPQIILRDIVDPNDEVDLTNFDDFQYVGPSLVGSNGDSGGVVYDTGSAWYTITTTACTTCPTQVYNSSASTTSVQMTNATQRLKYGSCDLYGYFYDDTLCLGNTKLCVNGFNFFGINSQDGMVSD